MNRHLPLMFALVVGSVAAQKLPLPEGRLLQLHDLRVLDDPETVLQGTGHYATFAWFARLFVEPPLESADDIRLLGVHQMIVLGSPEQCAWVERLVKRGAELRNAQIDIQTSMLEVTAEQFEDHLKDFFAKDDSNQPEDQKQRWRVTDRKTANELLAGLKRDGAAVLNAPRVLVNHMRRATMSVGKTIKYVSDFEVELEDGKPRARAISRELFDGIEVDLQAASLEPDFITINCAMRHATVFEPLPEVTIEVSPGMHKTVHLPRTRQVEFVQQVVLPKDSTGAVAVRRRDGKWLLTLITATRFQ